MVRCFEHGFRFVGSRRNERRPTNWAVAFQAYVEFDQGAECGRVLGKGGAP